MTTTQTPNPTDAPIADIECYLVELACPERWRDNLHPPAHCACNATGRRKATKGEGGSGDMSAFFSPDRVYRYELTREVNPLGQGMVAFGMLNGSTANENDDDPTVRRTIGFARGWGFRFLRVVNAFGLAATDPRELYSHPDPIGWENDHFIAKALLESSQFIAAWGTHGAFMNRGQQVLESLLRQAPMRVYHLGLTKDGHPKHPLYLPKTTERQRFHHDD